MPFANVCWFSMYILLRQISCCESWPTPAKISSSNQPGASYGNLMRIRVNVGMYHTFNLKRKKNFIFEYAHISSIQNMNLFGFQERRGMEFLKCQVLGLSLNVVSFSLLILSQQSPPTSNILYLMKTFFTPPWPSGLVNEKTALIDPVQPILSETERFFDIIPLPTLQIPLFSTMR